MALFNKRKLVLDSAVPKGRSGTSYSDFTKSYRQSSNIEDQRGSDRDDLRSALKYFGASDAPYKYPSGGDKVPKPERKETDPTPSSRNDWTRTGRGVGKSGGSSGRAGDEFGSDTSTPDQFSTSDLGGSSAQTTPTNTRKVSPEEAIDRTFNKRR